MKRLTEAALLLVLCESLCLKLLMCGAETYIDEVSHIGLRAEVLVPIAELLRDRDFGK